MKTETAAEKLALIERFNSYIARHADDKTFQGSMEDFQKLIDHYLSGSTNCCIVWGITKFLVENAEDESFIALLEGIDYNPIAMDEFGYIFENTHCKFK